MLPGAGQVPPAAPKLSHTFPGRGFVFNAYRDLDSRASRAVSRKRVCEFG